MTRRRFLGRIVKAFQAAAVFGTGFSCARSGASPHKEQEEMPFIPLGGRSLREMALRKLHHGEGRYVNPFSSVPKGRIGRVLRWKLFSENRFEKYYPEEPTTPVHIDWKAWAEIPGLSVTLVKHATVYVRDKGSTYLVDPVFFDMFWGIKDFSPLSFPAADVPVPDVLLITHGHYDHLNTETLALFPRSTPVVTPLGYDDIFDELGFRNRTRLDWFETARIDGAEFTLLPCNHWTMRNPIVGPNTALWGSYLVRTRAGATLYLSGDTGYFDGFEQIGAEYDIDLAVFNLGAYEPRWFMASSHANPRETVDAFRELGARHLMVAHWGTYRLGNEPVHFPPVDITREMSEAGLADSLRMVHHGQSLHYSGGSGRILEAGG